MLKTAGHVKKYYIPCCYLFEGFKNRHGNATFDEFLKEVEQISKKGIDDNLNGKEIHFRVPEDERFTFKGDMLEILAEIFFKAFANSPEVGITQYTPIPLPEDYGVDGKGMNAAGTSCAVQVKYRDNPMEKILYAEIAKTYTSGKIQLGLPLDTDNCIYVFTSAWEITGACQTVFGKMLRVINREIISREIDNNISFWNTAFEEIRDTLIGKNDV